jgi:hypothetical protein
MMFKRFELISNLSLSRSQKCFSSIRNHSKQSGFILMVMLVLMLLGAAAYFGNYAKNYGFTHRQHDVQKTLQELNLIKQQLLTYAVFQPELFQSNLVSNTVTNAEISNIPSPGYFPCPDMDGDGALSGAESPCSNPRVIGNDATGFDYGFLPVQFKTRNFFLKGISPKEFYYVVADRFVNASGDYNNTTTHRYAPLNTTLTPSSGPDSGSPAALPDNTLPWLQVNGSGNYVVLIIAPGVPQTFPDGTSQDRTQAGDAKTVVGQYLDMRFDASGNKIDNGNASGTRFFFSGQQTSPTVNDIVVGITFDEWRAAMAARIKVQKSALCSLSPSIAHWFNDYNAVSNPAGSNWREQFIDGQAVCP